MSDFRQFCKENPSKIKKILILISVEKTFICIFQRETHNQKYKKNKTDNKIRRKDKLT